MVAFRVPGPSKSLAGFDSLKTKMWSRITPLSPYMKLPHLHWIAGAETSPERSGTVQQLLLMFQPCPHKFLLVNVSHIACDVVWATNTKIKRTSISFSHCLLVSYAALVPWLSLFSAVEVKNKTGFRLAISTNEKTLNQTTKTCLCSLSRNIASTENKASNYLWSRIVL